MLSLPGPTDPTGGQRGTSGARMTLPPKSNSLCESTNKTLNRRSALTDFLASNNIDANQIRDDHARRVAESEQHANEETAENAENQDPEYQPEPESPEDKAKKRKRQQAIEKIKRSKEFARRKARRTGDPDDDDDILAKQMMDEKSRPLPGQLENCEICGKRFTVTPYSKTGPNGGLLCPECSKNQANAEKKVPAKKRTPGIGRRQNQAKILDGVTTLGAQSLLETCIKKVADNIADVEEFGDLPPSLMHRLSQILSRRRAVTSRILNLFLRPQHTELNIYDCASMCNLLVSFSRLQSWQHTNKCTLDLDTDDYHKILASMPALNRLNLRFVTPMKNEIFEYMIERDMKIRHLHLDSPNLVSDDCWRQVFTKIGPRFQSVKLWNLDSAFDDETAEIMCNNCTGLQRLKLKWLSKLGDRALEAISNLKSLEHLSLCLDQETDPAPLLSIINAAGPNLKSLSLEGFKLSEDQLLQSIHDKCRQLVKLRITNNDLLTDQALTALFHNWSNPGLTHVDFHGLRDVDMSNPAGPPKPVGLASNGFVALMEHSGSKIQTLNVASCRHISREAYETVFAGNKQYPQLAYLDISFNEVAVDDYVVQSIFRSCPALTRIVVFGCFKIRDLLIPKGVAVVGTVGAKLMIDGVSAD
ncbi:hypothetical protein N7532_010363 [Penicillium argentinense]|uniref:DNA repair protein rhp7 treble clef domain-containing protein n=1 Tax=Penicillium argentinense TaxID=1131581 RepID=A0A9W9JYH5_9EURO|nr:uncharacterized protein N7532_010363 [Penicillium argentinense]KAJ5085592.1 hypothetical protein N7532_010363 [Penicillium argentinense]